MGGFSRGGLLGVCGGSGDGGSCGDGGGNGCVNVRWTHLKTYVY